MSAELQPYRFQHFTIPSYLVDQLQDYQRHGVPPCDFLFAILSNDLTGAVKAADYHNMNNLPAYASYLVNVLPVSCWGDANTINAWMQERASERTGLSEQNGS